MTLKPRNSQWYAVWYNDISISDFRWIHNPYALACGLGYTIYDQAGPGHHTTRNTCTLGPTLPFNPTEVKHSYDFLFVIWPTSKSILLYDFGLWCLNLIQCVLQKSDVTGSTLLIDLRENTEVIKEAAPVHIRKYTLYETITNTEAGSRGNVCDNYEQMITFYVLVIFFLYMPSGRNPSA